SRNSGHYLAVTDNVDLGSRTIAIPLERVLTSRQLLARNLCRTTESQSTFMSVVGCKCAHRWKQRQSQDHEFRTQGQLHTYFFLSRCVGNRLEAAPHFARRWCQNSYGHSFAEHMQFTCNSTQMAYNAQRGVMTGIVHAGATKPSARTFPLNPLNFPLPTLLTQQHFPKSKKLLLLSLAIV